MTFVLDGRDWRGGIGRFALETTPFLPVHATMRSALRPTHPLAPLELAVRLRSASVPFFSHGYLPPARSKVATIVTLHDLMYLSGHSAQSRMRTAYMSSIRPLLRRCAAIVTMSNAARDQVSEWLGDQVPVVPVGGGVSPRFAPDERGSAASRSIVLYVGSRARNKNVEGVLRGFERSRYSSALIVTGTADDWAPAMKSVNATFADRVTYLGNVAEHALPAIYRRATALLMPSIEEGYGLPALEAMATGVPVVYGTDAAMRELVADSGLSVDPLDHGAIGAALDSIIVDRELARALSAIGRSRAAERTWPAVADRIARVIEAVR